MKSLNPTSRQTFIFCALAMGLSVASQTWAQAQASYAGQGIPASSMKPTPAAAAVASNNVTSSSAASSSAAAKVVTTSTTTKDTNSGTNLGTTTTVAANTPLDTESAINPLSGKSISEERLARMLNANKLLTEITRQQVSQAQLQNELALSADRRQAEAAKLRSDALNIPAGKSAPVPAIESLKPGEQIVGKARNFAVDQSTNSHGGLPAAPVPAGFTGVSSGNFAGQASGTITIGTSQLTPKSRFEGDVAMGTYVDKQVATNKPTGSSNSSFAQSFAFNPNQAAQPPAPVTGQSVMPPGSPQNYVPGMN